MLTTVPQSIALTTPHEDTPLLVLGFKVCIGVIMFWIGRTSPILNFDFMKDPLIHIKPRKYGKIIELIRLISYVIMYIYENCFKKISKSNIRFIKKKFFWCQLWSLIDFGILYEPFWWNSCLKWKFCVCNCIQFIFDFARSFLGLSPKCTPPIITKVIAIWGVRQLDFQGLCGRWNFLRSRTRFSWLGGITPSNVARFSVFQGIPFESMLALPPPNTWSMLPCWVWGHVDRWGIKSRWLLMNPQKHDQDWMFNFHQYRYILWGQSKPTNIVRV